MPDITVNVREKIAQVQGDTEIVCGNSDYTVTFDFDAEWDGCEVKTARFVYYENGMPLRHDIPFSGNTVSVPPVYGTCELAVGVYAGNIRTSTGAVIQCIPCITDGQPFHPEPSDDIYEQLMELLENLPSGGGGPATVIALANGLHITTIANVHETEG